MGVTCLKTPYPSKHDQQCEPKDPLEVQDNQKIPNIEPYQKFLVNRIEELIDQQKKDKFCMNIQHQLK